eukprot:1945253-Prymnesium_polylepis.1
MAKGSIVAPARLPGSHLLPPRAPDSRAHQRLVFVRCVQGQHRRPAVAWRLRRDGRGIARLRPRVLPGGCRRAAR